jgi:probable DNA metabolism protein
MYGLILDGSLEALVVAVALALGRGEVPVSVDIRRGTAEEAQGELFGSDRGDPTVESITVSAGTSAIFEDSLSLIDSLCPRVGLLVELAHRSEDRIERELVSVAVRTAREGGGALPDRSDPDVARLLGVVESVRGEACKFMGLLRFEPADGCLEARYEPYHDLTGMIAPHFAKRFLGSDWRIRDVARGIVAVHEAGSQDFEISYPEASYSPARREHGLSGREGQRRQAFTTNDEIAELWRDYYKIVAIPERKNERLQRRFLPLRYRSHLTEEP